MQKQSTGWNSTLPARGILKGSVQKTNFLARLRRLVFTAMDNSIGNSGGITLVTIIVQFRKSLKRFLSGSCSRNMSKIRRQPIAVRHAYTQNSEVLILDLTRKSKIREEM